MKGQCLTETIDVKKYFYVFYFGHVFYVFNVFLFSKRFLFFKQLGKVQSGKQINKKHFQNNNNNNNDRLTAFDPGQPG